MKKAIFVLYGVIAYVIFFLTFLYAIGFVGDYVVVKSVDDGVPGATIISIIVNLMLLGVFGLQHSIMARPGFKKWWTKFVPEPIERSTYVWLSSLALILLFWQWRPLPAVIWQVDNPIGVGLLTALFFAGWLTVLGSTFIINHFDLFGLKQVLDYFSDRATKAPVFAVRLFYKVVRHPLMTGFIVAFWATPYMTAGHLLFAIGTTGYILVALQLEERDLVDTFGDQYRQYQKEVPMLVPFTKGEGGGKETPTENSSSETN